MEFAVFLKKLRYNRLKLLLVSSVFFFASITFATPKNISFSSRIYNPDGTPLESASVQFRFSLMNPLSTCVIYSETFSGINLTGANGSVVLALGTGTRSYPVAGGMQWFDAFNNATTSYACQTSGTYSPTLIDTRRMVMQFNDGSGAGWQTMPAMDINSVPYSMFAENSEKLENHPAADFVLGSALPTCGATNYLQFDGTSFTCTTPAVSAVAPSGITAGGASTGQVLKWNGSNWVPSSDNTTGGGGTVTSVTSANAYLSVANGTSTPALTLNVGTGANTVAAGDDSRITGAFQSATALSGDLTGTLPNALLAAVGAGGSGIRVTYDTKGRVLSSSSLLSSDVTSALGYTPSMQLWSKNVSNDVTYSAGNVGIGTTAPNINGSGAAASILTIKGSGADGVVELASGAADGNAVANGVISFVNSNNTTPTDKRIAMIRTLTDGATVADRGGALTFFTRTNGGGAGGIIAERMRISGAGNIGIGTSTPSYKLDVVGDVNVTGNFKVNGINISTGTGSVTGVTAASTSGNPITVSASTTSPSIDITRATASANGYLASGDWTTFNNKQAAGNYITTLSGDLSSGGFAAGIITATIANSSITSAKIADGTITSADLTSSIANALWNLNASNDVTRTIGNVGIGTLSPAGKLDVQGTSFLGASTTNAVRIDTGLIRMQDNTDAGRSLEVQATKLSIGQVNSSAYSASATALLNAGSTTNGAELFRFRTNTNNGYVNMTQSTIDTFNLNFVQNSSSQMFLKSDGNVGIGTTTPAATLTVAGTTLFKNPSNSTTAYQFQDATGGNALTVDTTSDLISVGTGGVKIKSSNNSATGNLTYTSVGFGFDSNIKFNSGGTIYGSTSNADYFTLGAYGHSLGVLDAQNMNVNALGLVAPTFGPTLAGGYVYNLLNFPGIVNSTAPNTMRGFNTTITDNSAGIANTIIGLGVDVSLGTNNAANRYAAILMGGNVGIGTTTPSVSALLDVSSTTKGFLVPRMTTVQRDAIATPATGLQIYNTNSGSIEFYNGTSWVLASGLAGGGGISGSNGAINITAGGTNQNVTLTSSGAGVVTSPSPVTFTNATASTSSSTGALVVTGGVGVGGAINAAGSVSSATSMFSPIYYGGTASSGDVTLDSTSHATKGRVIIAPNGGKVAIGTPIPYNSLDVSGNMNLADTTFGATNTVVTGPAQTDVVRLNIQQNISGGANIVMGGASGGGGNPANAKIYFADTQRAYASIGGVAPVGETSTNHQGGDLVFQTTPDVAVTALQPRMTINASGDVGIGTTTPSATLDVRGTAQVKSSTNSSTAFRILDSTGVESLIADTTTDQVTIGKGGLRVKRTDNAAAYGTMTFGAGGGSQISFDSPLQTSQIYSNLTSATALSLNQYGQAMTASSWASVNANNVGLSFNQAGLSQSGNYNNRLLSFTGTVNSTNATTLRGLDTVLTDNSSSIANTLVGLNVDVSAGTNTSANRYAAILMGGNVGIGTTTPAFPLTVTSSSFTVGTLASVVAPTATLTGSVTGLNVNMSGLTSPGGGFGFTAISTTPFTAGVNGSFNYGLNIGAINGSGSSYNAGININAVTGTTGWGGTSLRMTGSASGLHDYTIYSDNLAQSYFAGNIGIGTITPAVSLDVGSKTDAIRVPASTTANRPAAAANGMIRYNTDNLKLEAYINGAWQDIAAVATGGSYLSSTGGTLTGALTVSSDLTVSGAGTQTLDRMVFQRAGSDYRMTTNSGAYLRLAAAGGRVYFDSPPFTSTLNSNLSDLTLSAGVDEATPIGDIIFKSKTTENMRIKANGNVGIGTTTPQAKLDVNGSIKVGADASACTAANAGSTRYNSTENIMEYCNGSIWSDFNPPGTICGVSTMNPQTVLCRGLDPSVSCPAGYTATTILAAGGDDRVTCVKN